MTSLLLKLFLKADESSPDYRTKCGNLAGIVGIFSNLLLFIIKMTIGLLSASISIMADAFNNLFDMGSSVVTMLGFRLASKPADPDHPYGHGRIEYISAFIVSGLIIIVGIELFKGSVDKIINPIELTFSIYSIIVLLCSIAIKFWMYLFNRKIGIKLNSDALIATAADSRNDALTTTAIFVSVIVMMTTTINIDAYVGLAMALFIIWSGIKSAKNTLNPLLGEPLDEKTALELEQEIMSFEGFLGIHDLITHNYGIGRCFASVHVEVPADIDIVKCHEQIDLCEKLVLERTGIMLTIHMDPVETDNEKLNLARAIIAERVKEIHPRLTIHDFRMTPKSDERTNLIFDVLVPADFNEGNSELRSKIESIAREIDHTYCCVITFDIDFIGK